MSKEEIKEMLKLYTKQDLWEFNQIKAKKQIELMAQIKEKDQKIAELEHRLSNCIEPKFKIGQELYWVYTSNQRFPFKVKVLGFVIKDLGGIRQTFYEIEENEIDMGCYNEKQLFATEEEARKKLEELNNVK